MRCVSLIFGIIVLFFTLAVFLAGIPTNVRAGPIEELRTGKSNIRAVGWLSNSVNQSRISKLKNELKQYPDYKVIVMYPRNRPKTAFYWGEGISAEQLVTDVFNFCEFKQFRCGIYVLGDQVVAGYSQKKLADAIEAYQLRVVK